MRASLKQKFRKEIILSRKQPPGPFSFVLVLDHMKPTYNVGKIFRTANALGVREIHLVGMELFNPQPCLGTLKQTRSRSFETFQESYEHLKQDGYQVFALHEEGECLLGQTLLPKRTAFVIGHEEYGHSFSFTDFPEVRTLQIGQFGPVKSLNASVAASIASYEYIRQREFRVSTPDPIRPPLPL